MTPMTIRAAAKAGRAGIFSVEERAFGGDGEARLVERIVADGDAVLELVAMLGDEIVGHVLFSRLAVETPEGRFAAVALAPLAVAPEHQRRGVGGVLVEAAHGRLISAGERLSVVLGDPAYYGRFGYAHRRAEGFESDYQCAALQALAWEEAPLTGRLVYPGAFSGL